MNATDPVMIDLGGKQRELRFTLKNVREAKKQFGSLAEMFKADVTDYLPELVFAGLVEKEGLTPDAVAELIEWKDFQAIIEATMQAFTGKAQTENAAKNAEMPVQ